MAAAMAAAAAASPQSFFGPAEMSVLSPLEHPLGFAKKAAHCALLWGGFSFLWQLGFERYAALLERKGYLQREARQPTVSRAQMLRQSLLGIAGTALPSALVQAYLRPKWDFGSVSLFGALALVPYVFVYVLLFDAYYYWGHRLCHAHPLLYRWVHKTHHAPSASLDAGSTSYMSFAEGFLLSGLPFAPNILLPVLFLRGNFWVAGFNYLAILCLFYLGEAVRRDRGTATTTPPTTTREYTTRHGKDANDADKGQPKTHPPSPPLPPPRSSPHQATRAAPSRRTSSPSSCSTPT